MKRPNPTKHSLLIQLISVKGLKRKDLCSYLGISQPTLLKILREPKIMNGYQRDKMCRILEITSDTMDKICTKKVVKISQIEGV